MNPEELWAACGIAVEEAEAIQKAARIWAERVKMACEEMAAEISRILSVLGRSDLEVLDDLGKKIDKELRAKQRKQAREREKAQAEKRASAARFAQYRRQELKWTAGRRVRPRQREYKLP